MVPAERADAGALQAALTQLAEQDPLIDLRQDDVRQEISVSLYGEVQKEVIQATLADEYGLAVDVPRDDHDLRRAAGRHRRGVELIGRGATRSWPRSGCGSSRRRWAGVEFRLEVELGSMPFAFFRAVEETVRATLRQGLHGWQVTDCVVTMTHSGYCAAAEPRPRRASTRACRAPARDFRGLTPLVLMAALRRAGTGVHEPMHRFRLEIPADTVGPVLPVLAAHRAVPLSSGPLSSAPRRGRGRGRAAGRTCWRGRCRRPGCTSWSGRCRR